MAFAGAVIGRWSKRKNLNYMINHSSLAHLSLLLRIIHNQLWLKRKDYRRQQESPEKLSPTTTKVIDVFGEMAEPICDYLRCHHKFQYTALELVYVNVGIPGTSRSEHRKCILREKKVYVFAFHRHIVWYISDCRKI